MPRPCPPLSTWHALLLVALPHPSFSPSQEALDMMKAQGLRIPLVLFGHMHSQLKGAPPRSCSAAAAAGGGECGVHQPSLPGATALGSACHGAARTPLPYPPGCPSAHPPCLLPRRPRPPQHG